MKSTKYLAIDKSIITEGISLEFNIFMLSSDKEMNCFKENGICFTHDDKVIVDSADVVYVEEDQHNEYEIFYENFSEELKDIKLDHKPAVTYKHASNVLNKLFANPEALGNYESSKEIVNEMIDTILDDDFTIKSLMDIATHDYYTHTHSINVSIYALSLGAYMKMQPETLSELGEAALLHDLGKSKVDSAIITKDGALTDREFHEVKKHSDIGYKLGLTLGINNKNILDGIRYHHEKMDGTGYPSRLKDHDIPLFARIIAVCDIFDALTSRRTYKGAMSTFEAIKLMKLEMNNHVDVKLLNKMIMMFR
ncbi:HD-GYP domain-containing protein [Sulfurimonas sp.]|uniref:HD-GYP domain-containing protein n=1 Tax=Sulfurimonas sp. TaxID=2022749 RepID=UPI0025F73CAD|nr:HD-GYP domain-containing protein [Sulfurimonas sp.]